MIILNRIYIFHYFTKIVFEKKIKNDYITDNITYLCIFYSLIFYRLMFTYTMPLFLFL